MSYPTQNPKEFCKIVTQFTGEEVSDPKQITQWTMSGTDLYEFSNFYFSCVYTRFTSEQLREKENTIYRLKFILIAMLVIIIVLIIK